MIYRCDGGFVFILFFPFFFFGSGKKKRCQHPKVGIGIPMVCFNFFLYETRALLRIRENRNGDLCMRICPVHKPFANNSTPPTKGLGDELLSDISDQDSSALQLNNIVLINSKQFYHFPVHPLIPTIFFTTIHFMTNLYPFIFLLIKEILSVII